MKRLSIIATVVTAVCGLSGAQAADGVEVRIGSKNFTESVILGELIAGLVRDAGGQAIHRQALGGTQIVFKALESGGLDIYAEYTGTLLAEILEEERPRDEEQMREALGRRRIRMSGRLGFNNTYALGLKSERAMQLGLAKISDLADPRHAGLRLGFSEEFSGRPDGWPGLARIYGLNHRPKVMDHQLAYRGLASDSIDITDLYSTDAEIRHYDLVLLDDDRGYFRPYHCVLLYRAELEDRAPQIVTSIKRLEGLIDNQAMIEMNSRCNLDRVSEPRIAADFLNSSLGLNLTVAETSRTRQIVRNLLFRTWQHLYLVGVSLGAAIVIAIPLGIWSYKWPPLAHVILGAVGIVQTLPSMAVLVFMIPLLNLGSRPAIVALFLYSLLPIVRGTYAGLKEIPASLKESAIVLGLTPRARLWLVELPMASRAILSGIKTAAVINVGTATIGALIGAGGYGEPIIAGIRQDDTGLILQGAVPAALMALLVQGAFDLLEPLVVPRGLRLATR